MKTTLRQILVTVFILLVVFTGVQFTLQSFRVVGASMETSFFEGEYVLVDKLTYHFHSPQRGDVIVFHNPDDPSELYIKRIIGEPGDTVEIRDEGIIGEIKDNKVYIKTADGELLDPFDTPGKPDSWEVPPDHYFVLGDNRNHSSDSRSFGPIPKENIVGKVWLSYWPPSHWGLSPEYSLTLE